MSNIAIRFALTRRGYYADFYLIPVAVSIAVVWAFTVYTIPLDHFFGFIGVGVFAWSFIEYATHRWILHRAAYDREHTAHHHDPRAFIGPSSRVSLFVFSMLFWGLSSLLGACYGVGALVGLAIGYLTYISFHDLFHHNDTPPHNFLLAKLAANHEYHHRRFRTNFGVTSPFWDFVFGTYQRPTK